MADATPAFGIEKIYITDCSMENPNVPESFMIREQPTLDVDVNPSYRKLDDDHYEVSIKVNVTAKNAADNKTLFICEVTQAGIFLMQHIPENDEQILLNATAPNILFPYLRQAVASLTSDAGFPAIHLAPFNFDVYYQDKLAQEKGGASVQ